MNSGRAQAILQLTLARLRLFYREPAAMFWTFGFPIVISVVLGIAFRNGTADPVLVAIEDAPRADRVAAIFDADKSVVGKRMSEPDATSALRTGRVSLVVVATESGYAYRFDPTRPESRLARAIADDVLQRGEGRRDGFTPEVRTVTEPGSRYIDFLVPGLVGVGLMSTGLWGIGFALVEMRSKKLLKRLLATPMRRTDFLISFLLLRLVFLAAELPPLLLFANLVFGVPIRGSIFAVVLVAALGALTFAVLGLLVGSRTASTQVAGGLINVVSFPMFLCSGVFFSSTRFPERMRPFIDALPMTALNDAMRAIMLEGAALADQKMRLGIVAAWGVVAFVFAVRLFKWR